MSEGPLTLAQRELVKLICDTFVPTIPSQELEDFYARKASDIGVDAELTRIINNELQPEFKRQLKQMLGFFENRLFNLFLHGKFKRFSDMTHEEKERYLFGWANSRLSLRRTGFQALKRLILFLNYSLTDKQGTNPNWETIGYDGPPVLKEKKQYKHPAKKRIKSFQPTNETILECDACVIGSGAGGSVIASTLSKAGLRVLVVEAGAYNTAENFDQQEYGMMRKTFEQKGTAATRDLSFTLLAGRGAGGGTVVNWMTSLTPPDWLLEEWERNYGINGLRTPEFAGYVDEVLKTLKVNTRESQRNPNNEILWRGCQKLGYAENQDYSIIPRNAYRCKERCGPCAYGCIYSAKQSTILNYLPEAHQAGAKFLFNTRVDRVEIEAGRVKSVEATYQGGEESYPIHIKSKLAVLAAGALHSPAILLKSGLQDRVGTGLLLDPTTAIGSRFNDPVRMWSGPMQTVNVTRFLNLDGNQHGFWLEAVPAHPGLIAFGFPWTSGRLHKELMSSVATTAATIILIREKGAGRVSVDKSGNPVCDYPLDALDKRHLTEGIIEAARIAFAAGSHEVWTLHTRGCSARLDSAGNSEGALEDLRTQVRREGIAPNRISLFSAHLMGGLPMGSDPSRAVVNPKGEVYGVEGLYVGDASIFPSSPAVNPMITIMAMARRTADFILEHRVK